MGGGRGEGEGGHIVSPLPPFPLRSLPPPLPWCSRWCWRYRCCWRCACTHPPRASTLPLMHPPSLSCARLPPRSRAPALPLVPVCPPSWWWCCSTHCRRCWCRSGAGAVAVAAAVAAAAAVRARAPSLVPAGPPVCVCPPVEVGSKS